MPEVDNFIFLRVMMIHILELVLTLFYQISNE